MRDPNRIKPFLNELGELWQNNAPDMRFGQLIELVFTNCNKLTWLMEEPEMLDEFKHFFNEERSQHKLLNKDKRG